MGRTFQGEEVKRLACSLHTTSECSQVVCAGACDFAWLASVVERARRARRRAAGGGCGGGERREKHRAAKGQGQEHDQAHQPMRNRYECVRRIVGRRRCCSTRRCAAIVHRRLRAVGADVSLSSADAMRESSSSAADRAMLLPFARDRLLSPTPLFSSLLSPPTPFPFPLPRWLPLVRS